MTNTYHFKSIRVRKGAEVLFMKYVEDETSDSGERVFVRTQILDQDFVFPNLTSVFEQEVEVEHEAEDGDPDNEEYGNDFIWFPEPEEDGSSSAWIRLTPDLEICVNNEDWEESEPANFPFDLRDDELWEENE